MGLGFRVQGFLGFQSQFLVAGPLVSCRIPNSW